MEYRQLGNSGLQVSAIGLGTNNFGRRLDAKQTEIVINHALDAYVLGQDQVRFQLAEQSPIQCERRRICDSTLRDSMHRKFAGIRCLPA